jgi:uncharacterized protein YjbJ (UPF0337 family)
MNWSSIEISWKDFKGSAQRQWGRLSEQQISDTHGKRDSLSRRLQEAYSLSKEETEQQISAWQSKQVENPAPAARS